MQPYTFATPGRSSSCPASSNTAPVHFSLFYRLRHATCSLTACHSTSPTRLSGPSHQSSSPSATMTAPARQEEDVGRIGYVTPHRSSALAAPTRLSYHQHSNQRAPSSALLYAVSPPAQQHSTSSSAALSSPSSSPPPPLLSTMDRRELSKVIVRDAVYARVLDLVPGREQVQVAVWTLSPHVVQIDGAVAVCAQPRDAAAHNTAASYSISATTGFAHPSTRASTLVAPHASDARRVLQARLSEVAVDANLFASLLKPYLGEVGCHGDVVYAAVDGVSLMT